MRQVTEKIIHILEIILSYLKSLLMVVFSFFFNLFNNEKKNKNELKSVKLDNIKNNAKTDKINVEITGYNEDPNVQAINNTDFIFTDEMLEKLILERFCQELEIREQDLTEKEIEYIKTLNDKIIPDLNRDLKEKIVFDKVSLTEQIKKLVVEELEYQFKLEQKQEIPIEKKIITPIIVKNKINNDSFNNEIINNKTFFKSKKDIISFENKKENVINIPTNNLIGEIPPLNLNSSNKKEEILEENIDTLFTTPLDIKQNISKQENENFINLEETNFFSNNQDVESSLFPILDDSPSETILEIPNVSNNPKLEQDISTQILEEVREEIVYQTYDSDKLDKYIENISLLYTQETKKVELEDKNYESLEKQINTLLNEINKLKLKKLSLETKNKLALQENKLLKLKDNLNYQKQKDIELEEANLEASIFNKDLNALEKELESLHIEDKIDLQTFFLNNLEDLDKLAIDKAKRIEKELLKIKLKKALHTLEIPSLLALPFIHNKYFMFFTGSLLVNRHLKFFDAILKRKTILYEPEELSHIKTGANAFEEALIMSKQNIDYLEILETEALRKYPELGLDADYIIHLNMLKSKLLKQQEKLLKKDAMLKKHNIKLYKRIRKLKKKETSK